MFHAIKNHFFTCLQYIVLCVFALILAACNDRPSFSYEAPRVVSTQADQEHWQLQQQKVLDKESQIVRRLDDERLRDEYENKKIKMRAVRSGASAINRHIEGKWGGYPDGPNSRRGLSNTDIRSPEALMRESGVDFSIGL